ncbi:MAG: lipid-A-disaccharide synthase [Betaproteobacteria bacterium]|nr:lipid-A-disaccharide synthase [Betaproteobacteria bacterium]
MDPGNSSRTGDAAGIAIVAGEASGDILGSLLIKSLAEAGLSSDFWGIAGPRMQAAGARSLYPMETLSVRGYVEVLGSLKRILAMRRELRRTIKAHPPRCFIGVDAPDFNLPLEARLRRVGIPTVHFVSPSFWAWRPKGIERVRKSANHTLLIFPFEEALYAKAGIPATYVGHPLAHALPEPDRLAARQMLGLNPHGRYLALLPGSRPGELLAHADLFLGAARILADRHPDLAFLAPMANRETRQLFETALYKTGSEHLPIRMLYGHGHDALQAADTALVASGTATLEALLMDCPHVITYRVPWLTYQIMKRKALLPWIGLPNILAGKDVTPEIVQDQATPLALADALDHLLGNPAAREAQSLEFALQRLRLKRDTPRLIAGAIEPFLRR